MAATAITAPSKKPAHLVFGDVHNRNIDSFKLLNCVVLPVRYRPKFYTDLIETPKDFTKMAYYNDVFVGAIGCRVEDMPAGSPYKHRLYIMTLGVLPAYRGMGIGSELLRSVLVKLLHWSDIGEVYLHVHTSNADATRFYERFNFVVTDTLRGYYQRIDPPDCHVLKLIITPEWRTAVAASVSKKAAADATSEVVAAPAPADGAASAAAGTA